MTPSEKFMKSLKPTVLDTLKQDKKVSAMLVHCFVDQCVLVAKQLNIQL